MAYRKVPKFSDARKHCCNLPKIPTKGPKLSVKFLNFGTPENFDVIYLKFKQRGQSLGYFIKIIQMEQSDLGLHCLPRPICRKLRVITGMSTVYSIWKSYLTYTGVIPKSLPVLSTRSILHLMAVDQKLQLMALGNNG